MKEICRICEKQYRKGYQHGFTHGNEKIVSEKEVNKFRWKGSEQNYSKVTNPPYFKNKENPILRVSSELAMPNMEIWQPLFREAIEYERKK